MADVSTNCRVTHAGAASDGNVNIRLAELPEYNQFVGEARWFWANPDMKKEMLATALTAISTELHVYVDLDKVDLTKPLGQVCGTILTMYVMRGY